ncbi:hypothetical protein DAI22_07g197733 [Oryza sativa Japonica Group]|nr:hypothetical protein DAI22_07g197733 [Oryza sativa Japonica Group]
MQTKQSNNPAVTKLVQEKTQSQRQDLDGSSNFHLQPDHKLQIRGTRKKKHETTRRRRSSKNHTGRTPRRRSIRHQPRARRDGRHRLPKKAPPAGRRSRSRRMNATAVVAIKAGRDEPRATQREGSHWTCIYMHRS